MDLCRKLLLEIETHDEPHIYLDTASIPDASPNAVFYHLQLLEQAGLLGQVKAVQGRGHTAQILGITWEGHDFLDAARSDTNWNKAKGATTAAGAWSFDLLKQMLVEIASRSMQQSLGLPS